MKIETIRAGGSALLHLEGRLDREWADHLSGALEELVQAGVRSLSLDFSKVTYASSAATRVLARWHQELTALRGEVTLVSVPPEVRESFAVAGYDSGVEAPPGHGSGMDDLRRSSWHARADLSAAGNYELSACSQAGTLTCHLHGDPDRLGRTPLAAPDCHPVALPERTFGLGHGAIGASHGECLERMGEFVAAAGCVAYFPTGGSRMADYLVGGGRLPPRATLTSGMTCEGDFSQLVRFGAQPDAQAVPLSELAAVGLEAAGGGIAGMVIAGETAGLCGARLRKSPHPEPMRFDVPAVREWLAFAPERTYSMTTTLIVGVVARAPRGPIATHLRPLGGSKQLYGHFHAAVFSYRPLPQRTVELGALVRGLFANHTLRDVLHLVWDNRGEAGVEESALVRGVGWVAPVTDVC